MDTIKQPNLLSMVKTAQKPASVTTAPQSSPQQSQTITNTIKESKPDQFIKTTATGAATGAVAGGFVGAFAFAKPMFNSLDDLLDAPMDKIKQYQHKASQNKNNFFINLIADTKMTFEEGKEALFKGKDALSIDEIKEMKKGLDDFLPSDKIDEIMQKLKENCSNKEMTISEFSSQVKTIAFETLSKNGQDIEILKEKLKNFDMPGLDMDSKILIDEDVLEPMQKSLKFASNKVKDSNKLFDSLIDNAKNGLVTKAEYEKVFKTNGLFKKSLLDGVKLAEELGCSEAGEMNADEIMKIFDEHVKKLSPKSRMKPAIIGAAILAVVGGCVAVVISKSKKTKS